MNCPHCGKEMEQGYLIVKPPVLWSPNKDKLTLLADKDSEKLVGGFFGETKPASVCKTCRMFVMKY